MPSPLLLELIATDRSEERWRVAAQARQVHLAAGRCHRIPVLARLGATLEEAGSRLQHVAAPCDPPRHLPRLTTPPLPNGASVRAAFGGEMVER